MLCGLRNRTSRKVKRKYQNLKTTTTKATMAMHNDSTETLSCPLGELATDLSDSELRETAYELLVGACLSSGEKNVSESEKAASTPHTSLRSKAASTVKKALGLRSRRKKSGGGKSGTERVKKVSSMETLRVQLRVSEQMDSRVRKALSKVADNQKIESMVLPLEMLEQLQPSDFPNQEEYEVWQRRNLKLLEAGLILYPLIPLNTKDAAPQQLRDIVDGALKDPLDTSKDNESMQTFRSIVTSLACRTCDDDVLVPGMSHWADGFPLNLKIYQMLLEACFDLNDETSVIEELDEVLELIKKTWLVLGLNQALHNLFFLWMLFKHHTSTNHAEDDLLHASYNLLSKVEKDVEALKKDANHAKMLSSTLSSISGWTETRLADYHSCFHHKDTVSMTCLLSMAIQSAKMMAEDDVEGKENDVCYERVDGYIKSSLRAAFAQVMEKEKSSNSSSKDHHNELPFMTRLAEAVNTLALTEKEVYSPILKRWHPLAVGAAVATLHSCYGNELKQYISGIGEVSPEILQVLSSADKLEKDFMQIAVENSADSEDGGKSIIREMLPYEVESVTCGLVKSWITSRTDRLKEWINRNLQQEAWDPKATRESFALSAVEVLRIVDEGFEAFFVLPISMHAAFLPDLAAELDGCLQHYIFTAKSGCVSNTYVPTMPPLTRCSQRSRLSSVFKWKDKTYKKPLGGAANADGNDSFGTPQLCCRINTLLYIQTQLDGLAKRETSHSHDIELKLSAAACEEGIQQLCESMANKVIFHDLGHLFWDGLYVGEVSSSRIEPFLQELDHHLEVMSSTLHDKVWTRAITQVMNVSFDCFLLVLLAGGPARAFTLQDHETILEDFRFLIDMFWSDGHGLPMELIEKFSTTINEILPLFQTDTDTLIEKFSTVTLESCSCSSTKSKLPLPPTTGQWGPAEPNTVLRVLCYRNDEVAAKFLKKTYQLPKKL